MATIDALVIQIGAVMRNVSAGTTIGLANLGNATDAGRAKDRIAEIVAEPMNPAVLGLRNLSDRSYRAKRTGGRWVDIHPGQVLHLKDGVEIDFGEIEGVFRSTLSPPEKPVI
jgi:hypothetical protein